MKDWSIMCPHCGEPIEKFDQVTTADGAVTLAYRKLTGPGGSVFLEPMQAKIIAVLIRLFGQCVSYDRLFLALYGCRDEVDWPNTDGFKVQVCRLRPLLRQAGLYIRTVHGFGVALTLTECDQPARGRARAS